MICEFVSKSDSNRLIVIFAGWSTDTSFYSHIVLPGWDTLIVSGYTDFNFPEDILSGYTTVTLFAWSLGVYAASRCFPFEKASIAVAVNGTEHPADDILGIPQGIYLGTAQTLNERNLLKFHRRMAGRLYSVIADNFARLPIDELKEQLLFISNHYRDSLPPQSSRWNRVHISIDDLIFPAAAQKKAWESHASHPQIIETQASHYVDLLPIIKAALPLHEAVGKRFEKAMPTYSSAASPQETIASHLIDLLLSYPGAPSSFGRILEIGPGTGFLTRRFAEHCHPREIDFVELFNTETFKAAPVENYFVADAEDWVAETAAKSTQLYDAVVTASVIQWFLNPGEFFRNVAAILKPGGILLCSTFVHGNLEELTEVNPYGLVYHSADELRSLMPHSFSTILMQEETLTMQFKSPRETLSHLIRTGVGGTSKSGLPIGELLRRLPTSLSYRPLYILAIKK